MTEGKDPKATLNGPEGDERYAKAQQWVQDGAEAYPGVVFQAIIDDQIITCETPSRIRELWCDELPPVWEFEYA